MKRKILAPILCKPATKTDFLEFRTADDKHPTNAYGVAIRDEVKYLEMKKLCHMMVKKKRKPGIEKRKHFHYVRIQDRFAKLIYAFGILQIDATATTEATKKGSRWSP